MWQATTANTQSSPQRAKDRRLPQCHAPRLLTKKRHLGEPTGYGNLSDAALLGLIVSGDERALGAVYDRYGKPAYGLAYRLLRNATLAEDAVQETFLDIWRSAATFMPERGSARTWILTLAHRRTIDLLRHEERRRSESTYNTPDPVGDDSHAVVCNRALRGHVQNALKRLPDEQRTVLELAYYVGLTQTEIAERLGDPLGTVKSRTFHGLTRLRDLLADTGSTAQRSAHAGAPVDLKATIPSVDVGRQP